MAMEETLSDRFERFILFGSIGTQEDRSFFTDYLKHLLEDKPLKEKKETPGQWG